MSQTKALTESSSGGSSRRNQFDLDNAYDAAFELALKVQGRSQALPWLVRAHVSRHGWSRWFTSSEEAHARMRTFAKNYPGQWRDFVRQTATSKIGVNGSDNWIAIGLSRLVIFLVEVGEFGTAREYALEMARVFLEELEEQPISTPSWAA